MTDFSTYEKLKGRIKSLEQETFRRQTAEERLREAEKRLWQIVQGTTIPTFVIDDNHVVTHWNRALENMSGITAREAVGSRKQWKPFYPHKRPVMADLIVDGAKEEQIYDLYGDKYRKSKVIRGAYEAEDFFPHLGKEGKWLFFTASPLMDENGEINGAIETLQDITDRKLAEKAARESENRYKTLLDFIPYPMVVYDRNGYVVYVNPEFTQVFGWSFAELEGIRIPYLPRELEPETYQNIRRLSEEGILLRIETKRLTKDGRLLDVLMRAVKISDVGDGNDGELIILRDITQEKRMARNNEAILKISQALPEYPELEDLLDYISNEIKELFNVEGANVILMDEVHGELFFLGSAYDDPQIENRVRKLRFKPDEVVAGKVIQTGEAVVISDVENYPDQYPNRDEVLGYTTRNLLEVPLRSSDRIIGVLTVINKKEGDFYQADVELLNMIAATVVLSIENARFSDELKKAYREVTGLNRAKDKMINHLSHELKTPMSVMSGSVNILKKKLARLPDDSWKPTMDRLERNLDRIMQLQNQVDDIIQEKHYRTYQLVSQMFDQCADLMESLVAEEIGEGKAVEAIRNRIENLFETEKLSDARILLDFFVKERLESLAPLFSHRRLQIEEKLEKAPSILIPVDPLRKTVDGIIRNAIENTPDEGKIEIIVKPEEKGVVFAVHDYGIGITPENMEHIFEGFFTTRDIGSYSTKRPFDFNAGGKGTDLLRIKMFSQRYGFHVNLTSTRCRYIPKETDICPGKISECGFCQKESDCYASGETRFTVFFPYGD